MIRFVGNLARRTDRIISISSFNLSTNIGSLLKPNACISFDGMVSETQQKSAAHKRKIQLLNNTAGIRSYVKNSMTQQSQFEQLEDRIQAAYDDIKVDFKPTVVLSVTVLRCRNVGVSKLHNLADRFETQFRVSCSELPEVKPFVTTTVKPETPHCEINETFKFILPDNLSRDEDLSLKIELYNADVMWQKVSKIKPAVVKYTGLGVTTSETISFNGLGEVDVKINKSLRTSPDFRHSLGLHPKEKDFRQKRLRIVCESLRKLLGEENAPRNVLETPVVSLVGSGGGYRAMTGMCGAMEALRDGGLLDAFTYACGLSGSAWYLSTAYALKGVQSQEQDNFHDKLRKRMFGNLLLDMVKPATIAMYKRYIEGSKERYNQPHTLADYFPGFMLGKNILTEESMDIKLSDLQQYVEDAKVPLPLFVALHVKDNAEACDFHAYIEKSPFEVSIPEFGIGLAPETEGSSWNKGFVVNQHPEMPLHFTHAMVGCAFSVLLDKFLEKGGEIDPSLITYLDKQRQEIVDECSTNKPKEEPGEKSEDANLGKESDQGTSQYLAILNSISQSPYTEQARMFLQEKIRSNEAFTSRNAVVNRTTKIRNFALGLETLQRFYLNPLFSPDTEEISLRKRGHQVKKLIDSVGVKEKMSEMSTTDDIICVVDAGVYKNVPTDCVLRPQRTCDVMIVMDFSSCESDKHNDYISLFQAAAHAWGAGLKFPQIDFEKITKLPPTEFLLFPADSDDCPTVLWFTLCNEKFKNLQDYIPRSAEARNKDVKKEGQKFNDFPVFDEGNKYKLADFQYDNYNFDQLRELMYFNVSNHIEEIKAAIADAALRKRRRKEEIG